MMGPGMMANMTRHHQVMMYGVPAPYRSLRDPLRNTPDKLSRGAAVFEQNCASCHGESGRGEGPAGEQLVPPPANLAWLAHTPMSRSDPYMYWTIAEGGTSIGSDMPSFRESLSRDEIWAVISYVREGLGLRR
jgi:mono/diheme cytochrome c family protein